MKEINLLSSAWHKDENLQLTIPDRWDVTLVGNQKIAPISYQEVYQKVYYSIGGKPLLELLRGKSRIGIIVDDMTRPTPLSRIMRVLIQIFNQAGVPDEAVRIIVGGGAHQPDKTGEIDKKIGYEASSRYEVIIHSSTNNLKSLGTTSRGTPLYLNRTIFDCDFLIGVGCIYPHPAAGFSGGAKILIPGLAGRETIHFMHDHLMPAGKRAGPLDSEFRREMEDIASQHGLEYIINVVLNQQREIAGVFSGDFVLAHRQAVKFFKEHYTIESVWNADVVVADMYPFDIDMQFAFDRGFWPLTKVNSQVAKIILAACPNGVGNHTLYPITTSLKGKYVQKMQGMRLKDLRDPIYKIKKIFTSYKQKKNNYMILSKGLNPTELKTVFPNGELFRTWGEILIELERLKPGATLKVAIYRCAPFLIPRES